VSTLEAEMRDFEERRAKSLPEIASQCLAILLDMGLEWCHMRDVRRAQAELATKVPPGKALLVTLHGTGEVYDAILAKMEAPDGQD